MKMRALEPPVAEQLGVVRGHHDGRPVHAARPAPATCFSRLPRKWLACSPTRPRARVRIVGPLVVQLVVGDGVVLDARVHPDALRVHVRADVVHRQVEADVAVEVAVERIARVALLGAPHLLRRLRVAAEGGHAGRAVDRRVDAVHRPAGRRPAGRGCRPGSSGCRPRAAARRSPGRSRTRPATCRAGAGPGAPRRGRPRCGPGRAWPPSCGPSWGRRRGWPSEVMTSTRPASCSLRKAGTRFPSWQRQVWRSDWNRSQYICASRW